MYIQDIRGIVAQGFDLPYWKKTTPDFFAQTNFDQPFTKSPNISILVLPCSIIQLDMDFIKKLSGPLNFLM